MAKDRNNRTLGKSRETVRQKRLIESQFNWRKGNKFYHRFVVNGQFYTAFADSPVQAKNEAAKMAKVTLEPEKEFQR